MLKLGWTGYGLAEYLDVSGMTDSVYYWENGGTVYKLIHRGPVSYFLGK